MYGKTVAVKDITVEIKDGELFILLGPSGCGKTTTLLCIAGLIKPDEGEIWFGDDMVTGKERKQERIRKQERKKRRKKKEEKEKKKYHTFERPQDRNVAMVFQDYAIYPHMTVFKNIAFPLVIRRKDKHEIEERVTQVAERLEISQLLDRKPKQLSGGQRQRVALARAIVREPYAFLMDEPLSNLDAKLRVYARAELKRLHKRLSTTIIYVTHDQLEAMSIGDRIAILNNGVLEQVDTPENIYNFPKNLFVAGFIGSPPMNMLDGTLIEKNGKKFIDLGIKTYQLSNRFNNLKKTKTTDVVLGIRPEHISISREDVGNSIKAKVDIFEDMGREFNVYLRVNEKTLIVITKSIKDLEIGNEVNLVFDDKRIHVFDKHTEENLIIKPREEESKDQ